MISSNDFSFLFTLSHHQWNTIKKNLNTHVWKLNHVYRHLRIFRLHPAVPAAGILPARPEIHHHHQISFLHLLLVREALVQGGRPNCSPFWCHTHHNGASQTCSTVRTSHTAIPPPPPLLSAHCPCRCRVICPAFRRPLLPTSLSLPFNHFLLGFPSVLVGQKQTKVRTQDGQSHWIYNTFKITRTCSPHRSDFYDTG